MESANAMRTPLQHGTVPVYKKPSVRRSAVRKQEAIQTFTLPVTSVQKFSNFHEADRLANAAVTRLLRSGDEYAARDASILKMKHTSKGSKKADFENKDPNAAQLTADRLGKQVFAQRAAIFQAADLITPQQQQMAAVRSIGKKRTDSTFAKLQSTYVSPPEGRIQHLVVQALPKMVVQNQTPLTHEQLNKRGFVSPIEDGQPSDSPFSGTNSNTSNVDPESSPPFAELDISAYSYHEDDAIDANASNSSSAIETDWSMQLDKEEQQPNGSADSQGIFKELSLKEANSRQQRPHPAQLSMPTGQQIKPQVSAPTSTTTKIPTSTVAAVIAATTSASANKGDVSPFTISAKKIARLVAEPLEHFPRKPTAHLHFSPPPSSELTQPTTTGVASDQDFLAAATTVVPPAALSAFSAVERASAPLSMSGNREWLGNGPEQLGDDSHSDSHQSIHQSLDLSAVSVQSARNNLSLASSKCSEKSHLLSERSVELSPSWDAATKTSNGQKKTLTRAEKNLLRSLSSLQTNLKSQFTAVKSASSTLKSTQQQEKPEKNASSQDVQKRGGQGGYEDGDNITTFKALADSMLPLMVDTVSPAAPSPCTSTATFMSPSSPILESNATTASNGAGTLPLQSTPFSSSLVLCTPNTAIFSASLSQSLRVEKDSPPSCTSSHMSGSAVDCSTVSSCFSDYMDQADITAAHIDTAPASVPRDSKNNNVFAAMDEVVPPPPLPAEFSAGNISNDSSSLLDEHDMTVSFSLGDMDARKVNTTLKDMLSPASMKILHSMDAFHAQQEQERRQEQERQLCLLELQVLSYKNQLHALMNASPVQQHSADRESATGKGKERENTRVSVACANKNDEEEANTEEVDDAFTLQLMASLMDAHIAEQPCISITENAVLPPTPFSQASPPPALSSVSAHTKWFEDAIQQTEHEHEQQPGAATTKKAVVALKVESSQAENCSKETHQHAFHENEDMPPPPVPAYNPSAAYRSVIACSPSTTTTARMSARSRSGSRRKEVNRAGGASRGRSSPGSIPFCDISFSTVGTAAGVDEEEEEEEEGEVFPPEVPPFRMYHRSTAAHDFAALDLPPTPCMPAGGLNTLPSTPIPFALVEAHSQAVARVATATATNMLSPVSSSAGSSLSSSPLELDGGVKLSHRSEVSVILHESPPNARLSSRRLNPAASNTAEQGQKLRYFEEKVSVAAESVPSRDVALTDLTNQTKTEQSVDGDGEKQQKREASRTRVIPLVSVSVSSSRANSRSTSRRGSVSSAAAAASEKENLEQGQQHNCHQCQCQPTVASASLHGSGVSTYKRGLQGPFVWKLTRVGPSNNDQTVITFKDSWGSNSEDKDAIRRILNNEKPRRKKREETVESL